MGPIKQGNSATVQYSVVDGTGAIQNITSWSFTFNVKLPLTAGWVIQKTSSVSSEIIITNAALGLVSVFFVPADTLPPFAIGPAYQYVFQGTDPSGNVYTLDNGLLVVSAIPQP